MNTDHSDPHHNAIDFVRQYALGKSKEARQLLSVVCERSNLDTDVIDTILNHIKNTAQIAIHFHPDRQLSHGTHVMEDVATSLLHTGYYRNQFETKLSSGKLTHSADGARAKWENMLFGSAYADADLSLRPKYGSLALLGNPYGPSPRFGSCYLLLKPQCLNQATFCYGDSSDNPPSKGTIDTFEDILASLLKESFLSEQVLGHAQLRPPALMAHLQQDLSQASKYLQESQVLPNLNQYIEAQVHGLLPLGQCVDALVADPSFRTTSIEKTLTELCTQYEIELRWHKGHQIHVDQVVDDFRGGDMSRVARKIAEDDLINPELIGRALITAEENPQLWSDFDDSPTKLLKFLWHVLIRFGTHLENK